MADQLEKKLSKKKEKKKLKKQQETLNDISEGKWRRLGSFASWVGYRVEVDGQQEVVPIRKNASRISLMGVSNNLKRYISKKKAIELDNKKRSKNKAKPK